MSEGIVQSRIIFRCMSGIVVELSAHSYVMYIWTWDCHLNGTRFLRFNQCCYCQSYGMLSCWFGRKTPDHSRICRYCFSHFIISQKQAYTTITLLIINTVIDCLASPSHWVCYQFIRWRPMTYVKAAFILIALLSWCNYVCKIHIHFCTYIFHVVTCFLCRLLLTKQLIGITLFGICLVVSLFCSQT